MQQGLIGVIVPVYKVEKYIAECIESILSQTYTKFRLILVDDGTPDNAGHICDEYAKKDPRITVIHQENTGVTRARARGVEEADDCEFITFVDGDDTLIVNGLKDLIDATESKAEIIITDRILNYPQIPLDYITVIEYQKSLINESTSSAPWGKLFNRKLFNKYIFDIPREINVGEDLIMNLRLSSNCNTHIKVIHKSIYNYTINTEGACRKFIDSAKHEYLLYTNIKASFKNQTNENLIHYLIKRFYLKWNKKFGYSHRNIEWYGTEYHQTLVNDIKNHQYNIKRIEYVLLKVNNPLLRWIFITIRKLSNKLHCR